MQQEKQELQHSISLLEEDNQALREEIQQLRGETAGAALEPGTLEATLASTFLSSVDGESQDFIILRSPPAEETAPEEPGRRVSLVEEQLRHTQEKLCIKESEVDSGMTLESELHQPENHQTELI